MKIAESLRRQRREQPARRARRPPLQAPPLAPGITGGAAPEPDQLGRLRRRFPSRAAGSSLPGSGAHRDWQRPVPMAAAARDAGRDAGRGCAETHLLPEPPSLPACFPLCRARGKDLQPGEAEGAAGGAPRSARLPEGWNRRRASARSEHPPLRCVWLRASRRARSPPRLGWEYRMVARIRTGEPCIHPFFASPTSLGMRSIRERPELASVAVTHNLVQHSRAAFLSSPRVLHYFWKHVKKADSSQYETSRIWEKAHDESFLFLLNRDFCTIWDHFLLIVSSQKCNQHIQH